MAMDILFGLAICLVAVTLFFIPLWWKAKVEMDRQGKPQPDTLSTDAGLSRTTHAVNHAALLPVAVVVPPRDEGPIVA